MTALPKPSRFRAMADAWDDPQAFAAEVAAYYAELADAGYRVPDVDRTAPLHAPGDAA